MKAIRIGTDHGFRSGLLIGEGRRYLLVILADNPVRVHKFPLDRAYAEIQYHGRPYPVPRAKRLLRDMVKRYHGSLKNVSKPVREALR